MEVQDARVETCKQAGKGDQCTHTTQQQHKLVIVVPMTGCVHVCVPSKKETWKRLNMEVVTLPKRAGSFMPKMSVPFEN
jgi:hypothetical protein